MDYTQPGLDIHVQNHFRRELPRLRQALEDGEGETSLGRVAMIFHVPEIVGMDLGDNDLEWTALWNTDHRQWVSIYRHPEGFSRPITVPVPHDIR